MNYWADKERLAKQAYKHWENMENTRAASIQHSVDNSKVYSDKGDNVVPKYSGTIITLIEGTSVDATMRNADTKTCVLNFASYKTPGGLFLDGSSAQEESLCHASTLFNVLSRFPGYYDENRLMLNRALYTNRAIYSRDICFEHNESVCHADVLTCAAPNKRAAQKKCHVSNEENYSVLHDRIDFALSVAAENEPETLILGAYGCGVFGQDPTEVAEIFKSLLNDKYQGVFKVVVFAIPNAAGANFKAFQSVFAN